MCKKTHKAGAAVCSVSSNELNTIEKEQVPVSHENGVKAEEMQMNENSSSNAEVSVEVKEQTETPVIPSVAASDETIQKNNHQLVNSTRNLFGHKDDETMFAADRQFVSSLIAEICYSENVNLDETLQKAKDQIYDGAFKKLEAANPDELYEDVCHILDISRDYTSEHENNPSVRFQRKIDDIIHKYALTDIDKVKSMESVDDATMLKIDSGNLQGKLSFEDSAPVSEE